MRLAIALAFLAIAVVACAPVEQPIQAPDSQEVIPEIPEDADNESAEMSNDEDMESTQTDTDMDDVDVVFEVSGENFLFTINGEENPDMVVQQGDRVRVEFTSASGMHDWVIDAFGATEIVQTGENTSVEFVADQTGTFEYYCSVGSHREQGMRGNFIVE